MKREEIKSEIKEVSNGLKKVWLIELSRKAPKEFSQLGLDAPKTNSSNHQDYQDSYTRAIGLMRSLLPERLAEFVGCYEPDPRRKEWNAATYKIKDYLMGLSAEQGGRLIVDAFASFNSLIQHQISILDSLLNTFDVRIGSVEAVLQASLFDRELETSQELLNKGHLRAAGAVAGVVVEAHLSAYAVAKAVKLTKKTPTIADYNDALKSAGTVDVLMWRYIQRLGDIRNLCVHAKGRDPTKTEVQDLVIGAKKVITELL